MIFKYKMEFSKLKDIKYISHLDLMRLFIRACRRAGLPLFLTKGFSPHPKISFKRALKLGLESDKEELTLSLNNSIDPNELKRRLEAQLPDGIGIKEITLNNHE